MPRKKPAGAIVAHGALLAFGLGVGEMVFMASPFAAYFYSLYSPLLGLLQSSPWLSWLPAFWLPHVATTGPAWDAVHWLGVVMALGGLVLFGVHAVHLYWMKFKHGAVARRLLYGRVRHPQYALLILTGAGFVLLWPRFINLILFLAMVTAYYALARAEESRMQRDFPRDYRDYAADKPMFIPGTSPRSPSSGGRSLLVAVAAGTVILAGAFAVRAIAVRGLETRPLDDGRRLIVSYASAVTEEVVTLAAAGNDAGLIYLIDEPFMLEHLLIDGGIRRSVARGLDLPDEAEYFIVRAEVFRPQSGGTRTVATGEEALEMGVIRLLEGVLVVAGEQGFRTVTEVTLPADYSYAHAGLPLL